MAGILPRIKDQPCQFLTLTLRHRRCPLRGQIDKLLGDFNKLRRGKVWKSLFAGAAAFTEVKIGRDGLWHPHLHVLALGKPITKSLLSREWKRVTGDSWVVDAKTVFDTKMVVSYVLKYVTKPLDSTLFSDTTRLDEAIAALKGRRLVNPSGSFGPINSEEPPDDGPDDWATVGRLDTLCIDAASGDVIAQQVLAALWPALGAAHERDVGRSPPD